MKIDKVRLKELRKDALTHSKKFLRLKEPRIKGCFWHCTQNGVIHCVIRYTFEDINKVYFVTEVGSGFGQVALTVALSKAKVVAEEVLRGGDPQSVYKAEKQAKKERDNLNKVKRHKNDIYVKEKAIEYYNYNTSLPISKKLIRSALDEIVLAFGSKRIVDVTKKDVIHLLTKLEERGAKGKYSVAANVQKTGRAMWNWGLDIGDFGDVTNYFSILASIRKRQKSKKKGRIMSLEDTRDMAEIHYKAFPATYQRCILLQAYTAVRSGCVTSATAMSVGEHALPLDWSEFNLEKGVWHIPANRMKGRDHPHIIDVPSQLLEHLEIWHRQDGYPLSGLVTTSAINRLRRTTPTDYAASYRSRDLPYSPHSWRANIASEIAEMEGAGKEIADLVLAHYTADNYIHTTRRAERKKWLQAWADKLDTLGFDKILMEAKMSDQYISIVR